MPESVFTRLWEAIKPPPPVPREHEIAVHHLRRRKRLLRITGIVVMTGLASLAVYLYQGTTQSRAESQFQEGARRFAAASYADAAESFQRAIELWPDYADAYLQQGLAYRALHQNDDALRDFDKAIELNPSLDHAYTARGFIFREKGDTKRAVQEFSRSIELNPNADAYFERGQTYHLLGDDAKAVEDFDRALAIIPDAPSMYRARSAARKSLGDEAGYEADRDKARALERPVLR